MIDIVSTPQIIVTLRDYDCGRKKKEERSWKKLKERGEDKWEEVEDIRPKGRFLQMTVFFEILNVVLKLLYNIS